MEKNKKFWEEDIKGIGKVTRTKKGLSSKETYKIWDEQVRKGKTICLTDALINLEREVD